jgi:hypothetical protein
VTEPYSCAAVSIRRRDPRRRHDPPDRHRARLMSPTWIWMQALLVVLILTSIVIAITKLS